MKILILRLLIKPTLKMKSILDMMNTEILIEKTVAVGVVHVGIVIAAQHGHVVLGSFPVETILIMVVV